MKKLRNQKNLQTDQLRKQEMKLIKFNKALKIKKLIKNQKEDCKIFDFKLLNL